MSRALTTRIIVASLSLIYLASCALVFVPYYPGGGDWPGQVFFDHRYQFSSGGKIDLEVEEIEVELEIMGQKEDEVRLVASQSLPFYRRGMMTSGLRRSSPQVKVETLEEALKIRIEGRKQTVFPVRIMMNVPRKINLDQINLKEGKVTIRDLFGSARINLERGNLKINNFSGSIEASVGKGNIEAEVLDLRDNDEITLMTEEGDLTLFLEPEAGAKIQAETLEGRLNFDFPFEETSDKYVVTTLNEGKAVIILRSMKGNINVRKIK